MNVSTTQQLNETPLQMTSRRTQHESTLTPTDWHSSPNVFKTIQSNLSRAHHITNFGSTNWMHAPFM